MTRGDFSGMMAQMFCRTTASVTVVDRPSVDTAWNNHSEGVVIEISLKESVVFMGITKDHGCVVE